MPLRAASVRSFTEIPAFTTIDRSAGALGIGVARIAEAKQRRLLKSIYGPECPK